MRGGYWNSGVYFLALVSQIQTGSMAQGILRTTGVGALVRCASPSGRTGSRVGSRVLGRKDEPHPLQYEGYVLNGDGERVRRCRLLPKGHRE